MDEARHYGIRIDVPQLERILGVPIVPTVARRKQGIAELMQAVEKVATGEKQCQPYRMERISDVIEHAVSELEKMLQSRYPSLPNTRWVALRLLEGDECIASAIQSGELDELTFNKIDVAV
jgi:ferrous iron transport protein B